MCLVLFIFPKPIKTLATWETHVLGEKIKSCRFLVPTSLGFPSGFSFPTSAQTSSALGFVLTLVSYLPGTDCTGGRC